MTGAGFKAFRWRHSLPQAALAEALGIGRGKLIAIEQGQTTAPRQLLMALSAYAAGLGPYESDPDDLKAFAASRPLRVNGPRSAEDLLAA